MNTGVRRHFNEELDEVQANLMAMAGLAEDMVARAFDAIQLRDRGALAVLRDMDRQVDDLELTLDEQVMELLALQQPMARDLRFLLSTLKISNDLERVGDHAVNLARAARKMAKYPLLQDMPELEEMAAITRSMLRDALSAFTNRDVSLALEVCARDDEVDNLRRSLFRILVTRMSEDPRAISPALEALRASQNLERIADLSTNVSEEVVFLTTGETIKHGASLPDHEGSEDG
jgi:phosphate transport system protein